MPPPAPWGSPPTPLLPRWYIETLRSCSLPLRLIQEVSSEANIERVGDLANYWERQTDPLSSSACTTLLSFVSQSPRPPDGHVVIPAGVDLDRVLLCPLRVRTRNCIRRAFATNGMQLAEPLTVAQLLQLQNFGVLSLLDLMCVMEAAIESGFLALKPQPNRPNLYQPDISEIAWEKAAALLKGLFSVSMEFDGSVTLNDALKSDLAGIADTLGVTDQLDCIPIADFSLGPTLALDAQRTLQDLWELQTPAARLVLMERLISQEPLTLQEIAEKVNLSRERVRQIQKKVQKAWFGANGGCGTVVRIAELIRPKIPPITSEQEFEKHITAVFPKDTPSSSSAGDSTQPMAHTDCHSEIDESVIDIARHLLRKELDYSCMHEVFLNPDAVIVAQELKQAAEAMADAEGIVKEHELWKHLPDGSWGQDWEKLTKGSGLHCQNGLILLRDTGRARVKAALLSIGHPATKEEIAKRCGLTSDRVSSHLSVVSDVVRADKKRWGLADWVEDEYEGIPAEIIQRIEEDGGATRLERLFEELPRMFGVTRGSVEAYAKSARFKIIDGYVSLADPSLITLRALEDIIHGRTAEGLPFLNFKVESRYFDGYSLAGLPPEIAKALGCEPDGRIRVPVRAPDGCGPVSVSWPLSSLTGASLGYLSAPLRALDAKNGERLHLVLETSGGISLRRPSLPESTAVELHDTDNSTERARELLERMKERKRGF